MDKLFSVITEVGRGITIMVTLFFNWKITCELLSFLLNKHFLHQLMDFILLSYMIYMQDWLEKIKRASVLA
jgi:hypothetical protein